MENSAFRNRNDSYYTLYKSRIASLIPQGPHAILVSGCASGVLGRKLKESNKANEMVGVEIFEEAAEEAAKHYDKVYRGDIEQLNLPYENHFDFVVCADVLEHLKDPWKTLREVCIWLKPKGSIVISIPNVRYWRILRQLLFSGRWEYVKAGILDHTHLRFFTRKSVLRPLMEAGFDIHYTRIDVVGTKHRLFNSMTFHLLEEFVGKQIVVLARKRG